MTEQELNTVRELKEKIRGLKWRLQALRTRAENLVPVVDGLPHAAEAKSHVEKLVLSIIENEQELTECHAQFVNASFALAEKIEKSLLNEQEKTVLSLRYVSCLNFQDIWLKLDISDARLFYLHRSALKKFLKN